MDPQLSNALSTMFLRHLVMFAHFETYALKNRQKAGSCHYWVYQLDFLPHIYIRDAPKIRGSIQGCPKRMKINERVFQKLRSS